MLYIGVYFSYLGAKIIINKELTIGMWQFFSLLPTPLCE